MWKQRSSKKTPPFFLLSLPLTTDSNPSLFRKMLQDHCWSGSVLGRAAHCQRSEGKRASTRHTLRFHPVPLVVGPLSTGKFLLHEMGTTGEKKLVWKEAESLLRLVQIYDVIAALGEITVPLFDMQIAKHTDLCTFTSLDGNLTKSFDLFLREKTFWCVKIELKTVTYYTLKVYVITVKQLCFIYSTISYAELNKLLSTSSMQKSWLRSLKMPWTSKGMFSFPSGFKPSQITF